MFYFGYNDFFVYAATITAILFINALIAGRFFRKTEYFPKNRACFCFDGTKFSDKLCGGLLLLSFALYAGNTLSLDLTIFGNYDQMVVNNIGDMRRGLMPVFDSIRFNPTAGIDHNIIYAISHNYLIIACWNILKQLLCLWLLYRFFDFIPVARRLLMLAVVNFLPAVFWVNSIVYSEQNTLIFVLLSLMSLKNYDRSKSGISLFFFAFWCNMAFYGKEINILLYLGILIYLVIRNIMSGRLTPRSFLHPVRTIRRMPVEYMLLWSMFLYSAVYLLQSNLLTDGVYLRHHHADVSTLLRINALELILVTTAFVVCIWKIKQFFPRRTTLAEEGLLLGGLIIAPIVVFKLQIACFPDWYKTWYMYLSVIFCTMYIFANVPRTRILSLIFIPVVLWASVVNYDIRQREEGKERRELAEFIISAENEKTSFYISERTVGDLWRLECFASALKYAGSNALLITDMNAKDLSEKNYCKISRRQPQVGDYVIVRKDADETEACKNNSSVYENRVYKIYYIGSANDNQAISEN